ncbi:uncharacterized protein LOC128671273 [Plodia interpunctella]|uniref:uncharacterized protein LOC128671273 n=1 Tax=Plodia interpunctella TaxID=58824 RepID=UPI002368AADC|nr:uncharacterized protein LOC128671273 [Plodia interpunctella]
MSGMAIPPFPSLDLAKLVLGYLAEEQLMTAYDEFLQASPYLDALRNEYDRIFMTSLKNILAEYRAVKIYVETCKPFALRKRLFQCTNLLDVVKFLVNNIDVNKIQDSGSNRNSLEKATPSIASRLCEVCDSLKLASCVCKTRQSIHIPTSGTQSFSNSDQSGRDTSVEATALSDLPGNASTRKRNVKTIDKEPSVCHLTSGCGQETSVKQHTTLSKTTSEDQNSQVLASSNISQNVIVPPERSLDESQQKIKEFNDILQRVCRSRGPLSGSFQDFATGVVGGDNRNTVPDSSTCENISMQVPVTKENSCKSSSSLASKKKSRRNSKKSQIIVVAKLSDKPKQTNEVIDVDAIEEKPKNQKNEQSKIKILSDVKVGDEILNNNLNAMLQNATSTPLLKMQTVFINGTPVYNPLPPELTKQNYSKDEIMAMPTIIIAPVSGPTSVNHQDNDQATQATAPQAVHKLPEFVPLPSFQRTLEPLLIEVSSNASASTFTQTAGNLGQHSSGGQGLVKTVNTSNLVKFSTGIDTQKPADPISASVPKDNVITTATETSTPHSQPPTRKSSSTPRRTSHVRVLDFTTPRRILHETIPEVPNSNDAEIVLSKSTNVVIPGTINISSAYSNVTVIETCEDSRKICKENKASEAKKIDWDADLRALVAESTQIPVKNKKETVKKKTSRKKKVEEEPIKDDDIKVSAKKKSIKSTKNTNKDTKKTKKNKKENEETEIADENVNIHNQNKNKNDIPIKPTINIISGHDWEASHQEIEKVQNKSNSEEHEHDTPEMERISLEKVMGARLNISDLLETPYKQALYDIQMETPRFLGPDIPDDPMSDIKIMNIPTPRFLNSSKGAQATPSSYSSRPTDYSSGGSYYKPDDQDYMPLPEIIACSESPSKDDIQTRSSAEVDDQRKQKDNNNKNPRPVRQCAKNVTYFKNQVNKTKDKEIIDTVEEEALSDSSSAQSSPEKIIVKEEKSKKLKEGTPKIRPRNDKGKSSVKKKYKSPFKKEVSKSFMKIKPRRSTPMKDVKGSKKRMSEIREAKSHTRKRTISKERIHSAPTASMPLKSRRKSSIPRKLLCTNNSESSGHNSPDLVIKQKDKNHSRDADSHCAQDSETEQMKLRWSDDGSQDAKLKGLNDNATNDSDDISKIQEYIDTTVCRKPVVSESEGRLHIDLVKRGFDIETAKIIERDLLDTPPHPRPDNFVPKILESESKNEENVLEKTTESESSTSNNLQIVQDEEMVEEEEEIELSVHECNEESDNYLVCCHDDKADVTKAEPIKLKDKFCMEVCIDDDVTIRLRATPFITLYEHKLEDDMLNDTQDIEETRRAVSSIRFLTPSKDSIKAQCYEIFDSTLTSLDTPLKVNTPRRSEGEVTVTQIVLEVENVEELSKVKEKPESKKRKRIQSGNTSDDSQTESKKSKSEAQYMLNSANLQNMDIETVLSKLHGP